MTTYKLIDLVSDKINGEWGNESINGNGVSVLRTTNFTNNGRINFDNVVIREIDESIVKRKKLIFGDVIIEKSGGSPKQPVGRVVYFEVTCDKEYLCNNFTTTLRPNNLVFPRYFFYLLYQNHLTKKTLKFQNKTTGILNLKLERYLEEKVDIPSIDKQKQIAKILDIADELRQKRKKAIQLLDVYLRSVFYDMFGDPVKNEKGWDAKKLFEVCTDIIDCPHSTPKHVTYETEYPSIRTSELKNGYIDWSSMKYVERAAYIERTKRLIPLHGDIVYGREGSYGEAIIIPKNVKMCLGQRVMLFRPNQLFVNSIYLWAIIRSPSVYQQAQKKNAGSTVGHVNVKDINNFTIIVPPIELQKRFAQIVEQVEKTKNKMQESSKEMDNLFNSLMQEAFKV